MYKKLALSLLLCFLLILPTFSFAEDTQKVVPGLGTLTIPSGIEVIPFSKNAINTDGDTLLKKENGIWYSIQIITSPLQQLAQQSLEKNFYTLNSILDGIIEDEKAGHQDSKTLLNTVLKSSITNNAPSLTKTTKVFMNGYVVHMDFYIMQSTDYPIMIVLISTDIESEYWKPIITKILNNIKR